MAAECLEGEEKPPALIATLRAGRAEPESLALAAGSAWAAGAKLDWGKLLRRHAGQARGAAHLPLPAQALLARGGARWGQTPPRSA